MGAYVWPVDNWQASDGSKYTGRRLRQLIGALLTGKTAARPLGGRSGVMPGTPASTVTATSSTCTVQPHAGVVDAQTLAIAGPYFYSIDAAVTLTVPAPDSSQTRVDLVYVQVSDPAESDGTSTPGVAVQYLAGTPGAGTPATPVRSLVLATVTVPKLTGGAPAVGWVAPYTAAAGGITPTSGASQYPTSPHVGQYVDDAALGLMRWDGAKWSASNPPRAQYTQTAVSSVAGGAFQKVLNMVKDVDTIGLTASASTFTFPAGSAGQYEFSGQVVLTETASPIYASGLYLNGVNVHAGQIGDARSGGVLAIPLAARELTIADGDQVYLAAFRGSGTDNTYATMPYRSCLRIKRVG